MHPFNTQGKPGKGDKDDKDEEEITMEEEAMDWSPINYDSTHFYDSTLKWSVTKWWIDLPYVMMQP